MRRDVDQYVRDCHSCQRSRCSQHSMVGGHQPFPVPEKPSDDISIDVVEGLPEWEWFNAIWVVVDSHSNMRHFVPCHTTIAASGLAELLWREAACHHPPWANIVSYQGPRFKLTNWDQIFHRLRMDRSMSTAVHLQTDGNPDRMNASMEQDMRVFVNHQQDDWVRRLPMAENAANNRASEKTPCNPFCATYRMDPQMTFLNDPKVEWNHQCIDADRVQPTMEQVY